MQLEKNNATIRNAEGNGEMDRKMPFERSEPIGWWGRKGRSVCSPRGKRNM